MVKKTLSLCQFSLRAQTMLSPSLFFRLVPCDPGSKRKVEKMFNPNFDFSDCEDPAPKKPELSHWHEEQRIMNRELRWFFAFVFAFGVGVWMFFSVPAQSAIVPTKCLSAHKQLAGGHQTILYQMPLNCSVSILGFSQPTLP